MTPVSVPFRPHGRSLRRAWSRAGGDAFSRWQINAGLLIRPAREVLAPLFLADVASGRSAGGTNQLVELELPEPADLLVVAHRNQPPTIGAERFRRDLVVVAWEQSHRDLLSVRLQGSPQPRGVIVEARTQEPPLVWTKRQV